MNDSSHTLYLGCTSGQKYGKWQKMAENAHTHGGANRVYVRLRPGHALELVSSPMCHTYPLGVDQTPLDLGMAGPPSEPCFWMGPNCPQDGLGVPSSRGVTGWVQDMLGTEVCTLITYLGHDVNSLYPGDTRSPLDITTAGKW